MKILHILNHSLPKLDGYAIRSANIIHFQHEVGLEPLVVTSPSQPQNGSSALHVIEDIRYYRTPPMARNRVPFLNQRAAIRWLARRIDEVCEIDAPDILHAHSPCLWGAAAAQVARRRKLPFVYEIRGFWEDAAVDQGKTTVKSVRYKLSRWLETRVVGRATHVVTIAEHLRDEILSRGISHDKVSVVPNGVDIQRFQPRTPDLALRSELGLREELCVGYVGTLYPWEGVEDLVRAAPTDPRASPEPACVDCRWRPAGRVRANAHQRT